MDTNSIPPATPIGAIAALTTAGISTTASQHVSPTVDPHDIALWITIISGSFSIVISLATFFALMLHAFKPKNQK